jgi:hypothetical protein
MRPSPEVLEQACRNLCRTNQMRMPAATLVHAIDEKDFLEGLAFLFFVCSPRFEQVQA